MFDVLLERICWVNIMSLPKTIIEGNVKLLVDVRFKSDFEGRKVLMQTLSQYL